MDPVAARLFWLVFRPSTSVVLVGLLGIALLWSRRRGWGRALVAASAGALGLCLVLPIDQLLLWPLENRFARPAGEPGRVDGIIVLGGAVDPDLTEQHGRPALNSAAERMTAFVGLARRHGDAHLAFAGGTGSVASSLLTESDVAASLFAELGLDRPVTYDARSRNTYENALFLKSRVVPQLGQTWILVTSAAHMPRSVGSFTRAGWPVVPWPVGHKAGRTISFDLEQGLPNRLGNIDVALHEWLGLVAYRLQGRTDTLFPGPETIPEP